MKLFDDIFREKVGKAFSSYDAGHLADKGWDSFLAKRNGRKRPVIFMLPPWGKAASIALVVGLGALVAYLAFNRRGERENVITTTQAVPEKETPVTVRPVIAGHTRNVISGTTRPAGVSHVKVRTGDIPVQDISRQPALNEKGKMAITAVSADTSVLPVKAEMMLAFNGDTLMPEYENKPAEVLREEAGKASSAEKERRSKSTTFMTGLSGVLAQTNDAPSASPGVSVGVFLEQKISRRISIRPGLALAMNSLGFKNSQSSSPVSYSVPLIDGNTGTLESFNGHLRMVTMELPINMVFRLLERKGSSFYLSAGASTLIYISQHFTGDFVNEYSQDHYNSGTGMTTTEINFSTVTVDNTYGAFSGTDYFGLASVSAGYSLPFGKTSTLLIEPFMQFPLSDLTSLDLRVRYAGISMKISIGRKKE